MGSTYRFISTIDEAKLIPDWFRALTPPPVEQATDRGMVFYFRELGPLSDDAAQSPVVNVFLPRKHRGVLTTAGEVHFLATPAKRFPKLAAINRRFSKWMSSFPRVFSFHREHDDSFYYYLEGGLQNVDAEIFALPNGLQALKDGQYFISDEAANHACEDLCRQLRLHGVTGIQEGDQDGAGQPATRAESE